MRNIIICCDGTSNEFGTENTNVVRLVQCLDRAPDKQRLYYDPGVGTLPEPGLFTKVGKKISEAFGLAFGTGLITNVTEAYSYLMETWRQGDHVYLFGFSRGAYTVRVLAGLLHGMGLLPRGAQNLLPYVIRLFKASRHETSKHWALCNEFRETFARSIKPDDRERRFPVHFMGVWDTVSSVGWVWNPKTFPYTATNPSVRTARHAMAIDERRCFFRQNQIRQAPGTDVVQFWFPGVHADVGGGYPEQISQDPARYSRLWQEPFEWILDEAIKAGMLVNTDRRREVLTKSPPSATPWLDEMHNSLTPIWWLAECFPKKNWRAATRSYVYQLGLGRSRYIGNGMRLHRSALRRIRESDYAPPNLSAAFLEKVRGLAEVPESLPHET